MQKPMALSSREAEAMVQASREAGAFIDAGCYDLDVLLYLSGSPRLIAVNLYLLGG